NIFVESTGVPQLTVPQLSEYTISFTTLKEQQKIGLFFQILDHTHTLQQRKLELLKQLKQAYLQKCFPSNNTGFPIFRFNSFFKKWDKTKLSSVTIVTKGIQINKTNLSELKTYENHFPVYNGGKLPSGYTNKSNRKNKIMISEGGNCGYVNFFEGEFWSGGHNYTIDEKDIYLFFLKSLLEFNQEQLYTLGTGTGLKNINKEAINNFEIEISCKEEQIIIGQFFKNLDTQIEIQTQIIAKVSDLKKAYLQKMFI
ncbi:MAG: restriction endonuclease subunit S, partial [Defluviitaleaceae bacterium]|nr:restriction endonuclease subunit S [Defluviitaleaceae bacterium]